MAQEQSQSSPIEIQKYLKGIGYPARKKDLVEAAKQQKAPDDVIKTIESLPDDEFDGPPGVMKAYGKIRH